MRTLRIALVVVAAVVLQTTLFAELRIAGVAPELGLLVTVAVAYREGPVAGAAVGCAAGLLVDCFLVTPLGLSALAWSLTGYGVGVLQTGLLRASRWSAPLVGGLGSLAGGFVFVAVAVLAGQDQLVEWRTPVVVVVAAAYAAVLAPLVFPVARWAARPADQAVHRPV